MRLDRALHGLRLFKSRSQAAAAVEAGEVLLNGSAAKASRIVRPGDRVTIRSGGRSRSWEILELPRASLSKAAARALVRECGGPAAGL